LANDFFAHDFYTSHLPANNPDINDLSSGFQIANTQKANSLQTNSLQTNSLQTNSQQTNAQQTLTIVTSLNQSAMSDRIELRLKAAYLHLGYQMNLQRLPAGRSLMMANAGNFDGELFRIAEVAELYPNLLPVPAPLERIQLHAFIKRNPHTNYHLWQQNITLRVAYVRGFKMAEHFKFSGTPVPMNTVNQAVQMLLQDKVDVLLEDPESVSSATIELSPNGQLEQLPEVLATADLYHFVHKKHQQLLMPLAAFLSASTTR
jgi:polar amino acid transport system substrate-binding protein